MSDQPTLTILHVKDDEANRESLVQMLQQTGFNVWPVATGADHLLGLERQRMEQMLRWLAAIVESSDDAVVGMTLDGTIATWNPGATRLYGWSAAEALGQSITRLAPPDRREEVLGILDKLRRGQHSDPLETVRLRHILARTLSSGYQKKLVLRTLLPLSDEPKALVFARTAFRKLVPTGSHLDRVYGPRSSRLGHLTRRLNRPFYLLNRFWRTLGEARPAPEDPPASGVEKDDKMGENTARLKTKKGVAS
jgi:PAS domain-containing protein